MSIILDEKDYAQKLLESNYAGKKVSESLMILAKYYSDMGKSKKDIKKLLAEFLDSREPQISVTAWETTIDKIASGCKKYNLVQIEGIPITDSEMYTIGNVPGTQCKRLAFTLLCIAKYWNNVVPNNDWWVNSADKEIIRMANINTSITRQNLLYWKLGDLGMIQFPKKIDNLNVRVNFASEGTTVVTITDFRNLGYQYLKATGESFIECANCGITVRETNPGVGRKQKYCKDCAHDLWKASTINSIKKSRARALS